MNRRGFLAALPAVGVALAQAPGNRDIAGSWQGALTAPAGAKLRVTLDVSKTSDGLYLGTLTSLDQGGVKIPADSIKVTGDAVHLEAKMVNGILEGTLDATGTKLTGTWTQGGPLLTVELTRNSAPAASAPAAVASAPRNYPFGLPLLAEVPIGPTPFPAGGKTHLVYELHITNLDVSEPALLLKRLEVLDGNSVLSTLEGTDLIASIIRSGGTGEDQRMLNGRHAVVFLWVTMDGAARVPAQLRHRITVENFTLETEPVAVSQTKPILISPPLRGSGWMALNGPGNGSAHRRALLLVNGRAYISQRFAIDWAKIGSNGRTFEGDDKQNQTHFAYGSDVLAVADGVVATVKDGIPENIPGPTSRAVPITPETIGGNHIILDLGGGRFAFYAHLQPGKIRVKVGDRVKRGEVMALLGNSGNSTEPHLHFHITNANSALGSEGLPYLLDAWHNEIPMQNDRVNFPEKG